MYIQRSIAAAGLLLATIGSAQAQTLKPGAAHSIDIAGAAGCAYYTVAADGFHLVATLARVETGEPPLRVRAVLAPGQSVTFSAPGPAGTAPVALEFSRQDDRLIVSRLASSD
ncbi:hypothetical protein G3545_20905 [Starkeya sp. ORNL1]|uniref:hypothetical protein n=1 Tax=Starkeya sp. ORNL1 TaxID=2709380 RepID=UPI001463F720|nr:hypothetical protein [Starkeya sp. ORNL1]QJP15890.1 hypothetical protein G3545_20905 [Starkeya sp. ORNL1]